MVDKLTSNRLLALKLSAFFVAFYWYAHLMRNEFLHGLWFENYFVTLVFLWLTFLLFKPIQVVYEALDLKASERAPGRESLLAYLCQYRHEDQNGTTTFHQFIVLAESQNKAEEWGSILVEKKQKYPFDNGIVNSSIELVPNEILTEFGIIKSECKEHFRDKKNTLFQMTALDQDLKKIEMLVLAPRVIEARMLWSNYIKIAHPEFDVGNIGSSEVKITYYAQMPKQ